MSLLLMVRKERGGKFGPQVEQTLFRPVNVVIQTSSSGKLITTTTFLSSTGPESLILLDSWTGHCLRTVTCLLFPTASSNTQVFEEAGSIQQKC
ncbi:hypothetical protein QE152_g31352 [Popillia japonica]|uniref:Uncharacterized protein n=1 Tax=Popillia japonica TaxID=7064 RepID=A0AAW1J1B6_POPJA